MNFFKKTSTILMAFSISASAFAGSDLDTRMQEVEKKIDMISTKTAADSFGAKLAVARPEPDGKGFFLTFDVLYWQAKVGGIEYATVASSEIVSPVIYSGGPREAEFDWTFAFKAGAGYNFLYDGWDVHAEYTYFRNTANGGSSATLPSVIHPVKSDLLLKITAPDNGLITQGASFATQANSSFRLSLNDINLDLGRDFFVSKNLSLRPSMGLKASWITFKTNTNYRDGGVAYVDKALSAITKTTISVEGMGSKSLELTEHERFIGVGPRAAFDTKWHLGNGISFYGDVAAAMLFGYFTAEGETTYSGQPNNYINIHNKFHRVIPTADFELGLMYEKYVMCETQHFSISLGYENQYFWEVNYLTDSVAPQGVGIYGVNLDLRWDF